MFGALQPEGCGFGIYLKPPRRDPGQVLHSAIAHALRRETPIQCPRCSREAPLSINLEGAL